MTANTAHLVFDEVAARSHVPLVSIVETCAEEAERRGLRRLALLGTRFTMQAPFYPAVFARHGLQVVVPDEAARRRVHARYVGELLKGQFLDETRDEMVALVARLRDEHAVDGVILGGTELPLLLRTPLIADLPVLDTTALHVDAIVERLRDGRAGGAVTPGMGPVAVVGAPAAAVELRSIVEAATPVLLAVSDEASATPAAPGKWSPREVVGHLVDSASNNHRRVLQARWQDDLVFEGYEQDAWVAAQDYAHAPWVELIELWRTSNLHLARVMAATPEDVRTRVHTRHSFDRTAFHAKAAGEPATLEFLMDDYVAHLLHHLRQVLGGELAGVTATRSRRHDSGRLWSVDGRAVNPRVNGRSRVDNAHAWLALRGRAATGARRRGAGRLLHDQEVHREPDRVVSKCVDRDRRGVPLAPGRVCQRAAGDAIPRTGRRAGGGPRQAGRAAGHARHRGVSRDEGRGRVAPRPRGVSSRRPRQARLDEARPLLVRQRRLLERRREPAHAPARGRVARLPRDRARPHPLGPRCDGASGSAAHAAAGDRRRATVAATTRNRRQGTDRRSRLGGRPERGCRRARITAASTPPPSRCRASVAAGCRRCRWPRIRASRHWSS